MNLDDFLEENGFKSDEHTDNHSQSSSSGSEKTQSPRASSENDTTDMRSQDFQAPQEHAEPPNKKVKFGNPIARDSSYDPDKSSKYGSERSRYGSGRSEYDTDRSEYDPPDRYEYDPDGSEYEQGNMFLYVESKRA